MNLEKSNFVIFHPPQQKIDYQPSIKLYDTNTGCRVALDQRNFVKYLGLLIDSNLTWKYHINHIAIKISKTVGYISRLRHSVPFDILCTLYRSLILPYLSYGVIAWGRAAKIYINKLLILQKRALRLSKLRERGSR